jgi:stress-induced morphogen
MWQIREMPTADAIAARIQSALPDAEVEVRDTTGGGDHFAARVVSAAFAGRGLVERHQMVYEALGKLLERDIHALSLSTHAPGEPNPAKHGKSGESHA